MFSIRGYIFITLRAAVVKRDCSFLSNVIKSRQIINGGRKSSRVTQYSRRYTLILCHQQHRSSVRVTRIQMSFAGSNRVKASER